MSGQNASGRRYQKIPLAMMLDIVKSPTRCWQVPSTEWPAWRTKNEFGESKSFATLAYFGPWDPQYTIILLASVKAGYKVRLLRTSIISTRSTLSTILQMIFPSPSYPLVGLTKLLDQLECKKVLTSNNEYDIVSKLSTESGRDIHEIPSLSKLPDEEYEHYPFNKTLQSARLEPLIVLHASGTTGMSQYILMIG